MSSEPRFIPLEQLQSPTLELVLRERRITDDRAKAAKRLAEYQRTRSALAKFDAVIESEASVLLASGCRWITRLNPRNEL